MPNQFYSKGKPDSLCVRSLSSDQPGSLIKSLSLASELASSGIMVNVVWWTEQLLENVNGELARANHNWLSQELLICILAQLQR